MGVSLELWRARIGCFVMPRKCRTRVETVKPVFVSLAIRLALFYLLIAEGIESNPGPSSRTTDAGSEQGVLLAGVDVVVEHEVMVVEVVVAVEEAGEKRLIYLQMQQLGEYQARKHNLNHLIHYAVHLEVKTSQQSVIG